MTIGLRLRDKSGVVSGTKHRQLLPSQNQRNTDVAVVPAAVPDQAERVGRAGRLGRLLAVRVERIDAGRIVAKAFLDKARGSFDADQEIALAGEDEDDDDSEH